MTSNAAPSGSAWIPTTSRASTCRTGSEDREKGEEQETGSGGDFLSRQDAAPTTRQVGVRLRLTPTCATHVSLSLPFAKGAAAKRRGDFSSAAGCRSCTSYASPFTSLPLNTSRIEGASGLGCISPLLSRAMYSLYARIAL